MKKYLFILACALAFVACDSEQNPGGGNGDFSGLDELPTLGDDDKKPTEELEPAQQQAKIQSVGEKLLAEFPATEFESLAKLGEAFHKKLSDKEGCDFSDLYEWRNNSLTLTYHEDYIEGDNYTTDDVQILVLLSNFSGLLTFGADKVTVGEYNGTKAVFNVEGKTYEAELTSSGKVTTAYFKSEYHRHESGSDIDGYKFDQVIEVTVDVPETVTISITEDGTPLAVVNANFSTRFTEDGLKLNTDALSVEYTTVINGYELKVSKTGYDAATSKAQTMTSLSKDGQALLTLLASADLRLKDEVIEFEDSFDGYTCKRIRTEVTVEKAENIKVAMDILGEIQMSGSCNDAKKFYDDYEAMWDALYSYDDGSGNEGTPADEAKAREHLKKLNDLLDLGIYYDNGSNRQADIELDLLHQFEEDEYSSWDYYDLIPVLAFTNGHKNKIEEFFTESAFESLIESIQEMGYDEVFGYFLELGNYPIEGPGTEEYVPYQN